MPLYQQAAHALGRSITQARYRQQWSQSDLARRIGMTQQAISEYEAGRSFPSLPVLAHLSEALEVPILSLLPKGLQGFHWTLEARQQARQHHRHLRQELQKTLRRAVEQSHLLSQSSARLRRARSHPREERSPLHAADRPPDQAADG